MNEKELVISVIELVSKALHKNKASTRIKLLCGIIAKIGANNYGLGLRRASLRKSRVERLNYFLIGVRGLACDCCVLFRRYG
ncbi:hypothetical protein C2R66_06365 [Helicobacter pylori]|nr:hypothetical protein C2R66_06365 [Helicobacter pylori]